MSAAPINCDSNNFHKQIPFLGQPGANGGFLLEGEARIKARQAIMNGDNETLLALIARTTPFAPNSTPLFHNELFSLAVEEFQFDTAMVILKQAPLRSTKDLDDGLLILVNMLNRGFNDSVLEVVDLILESLRKLAKRPARNMPAVSGLALSTTQRGHILTMISIPMSRKK